MRLKALIDRVIGGVNRRIDASSEKKLNRFLDDTVGVIHVGANLGQEAKLYRSKNLNVIWIEPIPRVFERLKSNIKEYPNQIAICRLITDTDGKQYEFNVANNDGASSSILEMKEHSKLWPNIEYVEKLKLTGSTLVTLVKEVDVDLENYNALILDTQGSELMVVEGAKPILRYFKYVKIEIADFESYSQGVTLEVMDKRMKELGYQRSLLIKSKEVKGIGSYYEALYQVL